MRRTFRTTTALVASLSIVASHLPLIAIAQEFDASQCLVGEDEATCLARLLVEGAAAPPPLDATAEAARLAEEAAATEAARLAEEVAATEAARLAEEAAATEAARLAEEAAATEAARLAEEAAATEAARLVEEAAATEAARLAEEAAAAEAARLVEEAAATEAARLAEEAAAAEAARLAEEATDAEAAAAILAEALAAAEAARLAEEAAAAEAARLAEEAAAAAAAQEVTPDARPVEETLAEDPAPVIPEAMVPEATAEAPEGETTPLSEADALAAALAAAAVAAGLMPEEISPEDQAELAAAQEAAAAAELRIADPVDAIAEVEAQIAAEAEASEAALQSLALMPEAAPSSEVVTEVITEETARQSDEDFGAIVTSEPAAPANTAAAEDSRDRGRIEGAILGGIAGLVVGSILSGNRQVVNRADDRVVVLRPQGDYQVIRDDDALMRRPGNAVVTESFADGSSRNVITQPDGTQVITVRGPDLQILRRTVVAPNGTRTVLIDDTRRFEPVLVSQLPQIRPGAGMAAAGTSSDQAALARALAAQGVSDRGFSLAQVRGIRAVRDLAPAVNLENVTFASGSAAITPDQAAQLLSLGRFMADAIARNPGEIFLIEGHTDAVGSAAFNLALSDRRAETVALALTEFFGVPPQNMVIQGYGEEFLLIPTLDNERLNRRVAVRRITDLLRVAAAN